MAAPMSPSTVFPLQQRLQAFPALPQKGVQVRDKRGRGKAVTWPPEDQICQAEEQEGSSSDHSWLRSKRIRE